MESLPLKVLDFGFRRPTGPSSGAVAHIVLVSSRLDCPGISLAEVCATYVEGYGIFKKKIIFLNKNKLNFVVI